MITYLRSLSHGCISNDNIIFHKYLLMCGTYWLGLNVYLVGQYMNAAFANGRTWPGTKDLVFGLELFLTLGMP